MPDPRYWRRNSGFDPDRWPWPRRDRSGQQLRTDTGFPRQFRRGGVSRRNDMTEKMKKAFIVRNFKDAGTEKKFTAAATADLPEGVLRNRSEERRVGQERVIKCRTRWSPLN